MGLVTFKFEWRRRKTTILDGKQQQKKIADLEQNILPLKFITIVLPTIQGKIVLC